VAVLMIIELPGATTAMYDQVNEQAGISQENLPEGLISHQAGATDDGILIADVWESEEALERFTREQIGPILERMGVPPAKPRVFPVHSHIEKGQGDRAGVMLVIESDGFSPGDYDAVTSKMDAHRGDGSNHPSVTHIAAVSDGGMVFVDVWDSPESFGRFAEEQLGPASAGANLPELEPRFVPVHNRFAR
jgi:hypothetical protein